jgi:hypothetical protein
MSQGGLTVTLQLRVNLGSVKIDSRLSLQCQDGRLDSDHGKEDRR